MIGQSANPIFIICSDDLEEQIKSFPVIKTAKLSSVIADEVLSIPVYGMVVSSERDRLLAEKLNAGHNLDVDILELSPDQTPEEAVMRILAGQIGRGEISRSGMVREIISLENELDRLERRIQEIQDFMHAAAVGESITVFSNLRKKTAANLTITNRGLSIGPDRIGANTGFHCRMPVPLSDISCIHFENVKCDLEQGCVKFSLIRLADNQPIIFWTLRPEDIRADHSILLYVPEAVSGKDIDVLMNISVEDFTAGEQVQFPVGETKADKTSHIHFDGRTGLPRPLCFAISKGLPFMRSTPYTGCIYPDAFSRPAYTYLRKSTLYSAEQVWPKRKFAHELVAERTYTNTGLLVHPVVGNTTCAHVELKDELSEKPDKIVIHTRNDSDKNEGILFSAFLADSALPDRVLKKRLGQIEDWMLVSPGAEAAFPVPCNGAIEHLYLVSAVEKGVSNEYGWLLVDNVKFIYA